MVNRPIIEGRAQVLVGDTTSHGGVVVSGSPTTLIEGRPIARIGDMVSCPLCKPHLFPIVECSPFITDLYLGVALHGHKTACGATLISAAAGIPGEAAPATPNPLSSFFSKLLGGKGEGGGGTPTMGELVNKSPTLQKDLRELFADDWSVKWGEAGKGSFATRSTKTITLDPKLKDHPLLATSVLAHEVGHAKYPYVPDYSSKNAYVQGALADEGAAAIKNIQVQREIIKAGGPDIGIAGHHKNHATYNKVFDQYMKDGDFGIASKKIGAVFEHGELASTSGETYGQYYGRWFDENKAKK